jgi:hypothetical protein
MLAILWWFRPLRPRDIVAAIVPASLVALVLASHAVLRFPKSQLWFGAWSLGEMAGSIVEGSLYRPNPWVLNPLLLPLFEWLRPAVFPILGLALAGAACAAAFERKLPGLGLLSAAILTAAVAVHLALHLGWQILLPKDRTALWLVPLLAIAAGSLVSAAFKSRAGRAARTAMDAALWVTAVYFVGCLRISHFKEWRWNADTREVYGIVAEYNRRFGITRIQTTWKDASALNCYRAMSDNRTLPSFEGVRRFEPGMQLYILDDPFDRPFADAQGLRIVYRGDLSEISIAVDPKYIDARHAYGR